MRKLAGWISIVFDSSVLSLFIFPAIGWYVAGWVGVGWAFVAFLILTGIPLAYVLLGMRRGWVSDLELSKREQRPLFILVSFSSDLLGLLILWLGGAPHQIWVLALIYASLGLTMFTVSSYWKISLHMVGVSGFSVLLIAMFGSGVWWTLLSLPLVAWARLQRRKHDVWQLLGGAVGGALITTAVLWATGYI